MLKFITKVFGTKHEKDVKKINPIVEEINEIYEEWKSLSDDEIRAKTEEFKEIIRENTQELEDEKKVLTDRLRKEALNAADTIEIKAKISKFDDEIFEVVNDTLDEILPEAFAAVKHACARLKEQRYRYEYAGEEYTWDMVPYDVQLIGGVVLHQGKIAEMATGEGKTLVAVLPLYLNALAGKGAHLVTVNDYLAKRDAEWMEPVFRFLGLTVGAIQSNMDPEDRRKIYNRDITYGTNNEFGFDYLRDNMTIHPDQLVQREHWFSIVDEVDSVLVDEARTPLIISGPVPQTDQKFDEMNPRVKRLVDAQSRLVTSIVADAEKLLESDKKEDILEGGVLIFRAFRGLPKQKRLSKLLQEPDYQKLKKDTELEFLRDQGKRMPEIDEELYYVIDEKNHTIDITEKGRDLLSSAQEDADMWILPDIAAIMSEIEGNKELSKEEKQRKIDEANLIYAERNDRIHTVSQLLRAYSLYEKDVDYVIQDGKIMIVDEFTGRILDGRRYSEGLHQAIEAKEHVKVERDTQTHATITLQNYFRLYKKLAGMTGTAETEAAEFEKIYKLEVTVIPTNKPIIRKDYDDLIYRTKREKYNAIVEQVEGLLKDGRAVLVGTASVEVSELLSKMFRRKRIRHNVLNAKHHAREAEIVRHAGKRGAVTIATNMAGRGTDIKLDPRVKESGGLAIVGSERHDARRIDRQLRGRSGRQGDPGSSQFFISLEDNLMRLFGGEKVAGIMQRIKVPEGEPIQHSMMTKAVSNAQKKVEENNFGIRKRLLEYDDVMNKQREVIYARRRHALLAERLKGDIFESIDDIAGQWYENYHPEKDLNALKNECRSNLLCEPNILSAEEFEKMDEVQAVEAIMKSANEFYERKEQMLGSEFMGHLEKIAVLQTIDEHWKEHLRAMDDLKEGIYLRSYGQKNPIMEYKGEAYTMFRDLIEQININSVNLAFKYFPKVEDDRPRRRKAPAAPKRSEPEAALPTFSEPDVSASNFQYEHSSQAPEYATGAAPQAPEMRESEGGPKVKTYRKREPDVGRNDPCPCGSGKKYKHCHGR